MTDPTAPTTASDLPLPEGVAARYDVIIVGGSMAGLTAALVLGRARRSVLVVDAGRPINRGTPHSQGFPTRDGTSPAELVRLLRAEVAGYGVEVVDDEVTAALVDPGGFAVLRADGPPAVGRTLVLATGGRFPLPDLPGLDRIWGTDAAMCPYCHGWELRDRPLVTISENPMMAAAKARMLTQWSDDVTAILPTVGTAGEHEDAARRAGVRLAYGTPTEVVLDGDRLVGLALDDGTVVPCRGLFLGGMPEPSTELAVALGAELTTDGMAVGFVAADREGATSVPGLFAIGNASDPSHQLTGAADAGTRAARTINHRLLDLDHPPA